MRHETVNHDQQILGIAWIQFDPGTTWKLHPDIAGRIAQMADLDGQELSSRIDRVSDLSSPLVEGRGRDTVLIAEISDRQIGLFMTLNQMCPPPVNSWVWQTSHRNLQVE